MNPTVLCRGRAPAENGKAIDRALLEGRRGPPAGGSLAGLLRGMGARDEKRGPHTQHHF